MATVLQGPSPLARKLLSISLDFNANFSIVSKKSLDSIDKQFFSVPMQA